MRAQHNTDIKLSRARPSLHAVQTETSADIAPERKDPSVIKERLIAKQFEYASGRTVQLEAAPEERLIISNAEGAVELMIRFTPEGPVLSFATTAISVESRGVIKLASESLHIETQQNLTMSVGGSLQQTVGQQVSMQAGGPLFLESRRAEIKTALGDIALNANDDVRIQGERIRMNC